MKNNTKTIEQEEQQQQQQEIELLPQGTPVQDVITLPIDRKKPIDTQWFKEYGGITYPINLQNKYGKTYDDGQLKAIIENGFTTGIVSRKYLYIPHGPIDRMVNEFVDNPANGLIPLGEPKVTSHGRNKYWLLIDDKHTLKVQNSFEKNDEIKFGVAIRNSVGGRLAFGCDLFTYRSICMNGAVFGYKDLGSFSMRHFGSNLEKMTNALFNTLKNQLGRASEIINYYNKFATTRLGNNKELFERLAENISLKYLPDEDKGLVVKLPNKKKGQEREFVIKKELQEKTLWFLFNEMTRNIWHEKALSFDMIRHSTKKLHEILCDEVTPKQHKQTTVSDRYKWFRG